MTQSDLNIQNTQNGSSLCLDITANLEALATNSAGNNAPTVTFSRQFWADETDKRLKIRNKGNTGYFDLGPLEPRHWLIHKDDAEQLIASNTITAIEFNTATNANNNGGAYDFTTHEWTCPNAGLWQFYVGVIARFTASGNEGQRNQVGFVTNGVQYWNSIARGLVYAGDTTFNTFTHSLVLEVAANQVVVPSVWFTPGGIQIKPEAATYFFAKELT